MYTSIINSYYTMLLRWLVGYVFVLASTVDVGKRNEYVLLG
jgi:hypothetical protein